MSFTTESAQALHIVADWIDASAADDATAFVHSTAIRDAVDLMQRQAICISDLRRELDSRRQAEVGVAQKVMRYRATLRMVGDKLRAARRPTLRLCLELRDMCDSALEGDA